MFEVFLRGQIFAFSQFLVCYNGYQSLSLIKISSRFEEPVKSYVESTIQILKIIFLRLRGGNSHDKVIIL